MQDSKCSGRQTEADDKRSRRSDHILKCLRYENSSGVICRFPPFCHDGTERRIQRPKEPNEQKFFYSGKKKSHTVKNLLLINESCSVIFLSETVEGKRHDKKLADTAPYKLPAESRLLQDTGFQGFTLDNVCILMPQKKPKGGELTAEQKMSNKQISKIRIRIEHVNSSVKRCRIVKDVIRLFKSSRDLVMEICCSLHNLRVHLSPWKTMA